MSHVSGVIGVTSGARVVVSFWTSTACCSATRRLRVSFAFLAASLRFCAAILAFFVTAALTPAARCFRLAAAFFPAARCFLVAAAFFAMALRFVAFFIGGKYIRKGNYRAGAGTRQRLSFFLARNGDLGSVPK